MDIETRSYLKKMIEDAGRAQLIISVLQRLGSQMSESEVDALNIAYANFMGEAKNYLEINDEGKLVVSDPEELKRLGLEAPQEAPAETEGTATADGEEEDEAPPAETPAPAKKPTGKKKDGYT